MRGDSLTSFVSKNGPTGGAGGGAVSATWAQVRDHRRGHTGRLPPHESSFRRQQVWQLPAQPRRAASPVSAGAVLEPSAMPALWSLDPGLMAWRPTDLSW